MTQQTQKTQKIQIMPQFNHLSKDDKELVQDLVQENIDGKMDSYLKKIFKKDDAEVAIKYVVSYHEVSKKYDADFMFTYDGENFIYKKEGFKILADLVNHAFQHFKEKLSKK